ncbi:DCC1-like thiol-disulfide oxidoreductase family protein [Leptospira yanagawae]|uniref:DCC1-like thiol-disulfide oxidoreductase family protein n=1 Tax=Leptospira yanagawae TaxID=293069 RepID=UPI0005874D86|nr:DCC1-like thiol-disulfide oxidoreductase family protein [Leptospira yanagawae]
MNNTAKNLLIYDGNCGFCTGLAQSLKKNSVKPIEILSFHTLSELDLKKIHNQLTIEICKGEVQWIQNGNRYPGFFGVRVLLWNIKFFRYFVWILYLPLVPFLGMFALYVLKKIRIRLS